MDRPKNPKGGAPFGSAHSAKSREVERTLRRLCEQEDYRRVRQMLDVALDAAAMGDADARKFISEKLDGKPRQAVELTGAGEGPVQIADARSLMDVSVDDLMARIRESEGP